MVLKTALASCLIEAQVLSPCCCWHRRRTALAKTGERDGRDRKLTRVKTRQAEEARTSPLTLVLERLVVFLASPPPAYFQENFLGPSIRLSPAPVPFFLLFVVITASPKGTVVFYCVSRICPTVPPHSGCFIQKTRADPPPPNTHRHTHI